MLSRALQRATISSTVLSRQAGPGAMSIRVLSKASNASESYTERQEKTGRPLSPHVGIYKFPAGALSSITNRITGVALVGGVYGIGLLSLAGCDATAMMSTMGSSVAGPAVKLAVAFPLVFHYLGGARHTMWDFMPETLQNKGVESTSLALFATSGVISLGLAAM